jgi:GH25 family lysozyme M1 (1,4-beta-N-acetylmuramidase)
MTGSNGIDVSNNNGTLNLEDGFTNLDFVIAKVTEGTGFADSTHRHYRAEAESVGALFGAYHFLHAENRDGEAEAAFFLRHFTPVSGVGVWIDYETFGRNATADANAIAAFAGTIKERFPKQKVGLYSNRVGMDRVVPLRAGLKVDAYWLAYPTGRLETPDGPMPEGASWDIHQYETFHGVDRDYSRWTKQQMRQFFTWH